MYTQYFQQGITNNIKCLDCGALSSSTEMFKMLTALFLISSISAKYYLAETREGKWKARTQLTGM